MTSPSPRAEYEARARQTRDTLSELDRRSGRIANLRGVLFAGFAALVVMIFADRLPGEAWWGVAAVLIAYAVVAIWHGRVIGLEDRARIRLTLNERGLGRLGGTWHAFTERGDRYVADDWEELGRIAPGAVVRRGNRREHLYAQDLDVFGQGSLFQLLEETGTRTGEDALACFLACPAEEKVIRERQNAVRELAGLTDFRQALVVEGRLLQSTKAHPAKFIAWAEHPGGLDSVRWARALPFVLPPLALALYLAEGQGFLPRWAPWVGLLLLGAAVSLTRKALGEYFDRLSSGERGFVRFGPMFAEVERQRFTDPLLQKLQHGLSPEGQKVSDRLDRFSRVFAFAEARLTQFHPVLNVLLLWDLFWMFRLESWRQSHGAQLREWFEALSELEALCCLATFAHDHPDHVFPEIVSEGPRLQARGLGHPLLDAPVRNDVELSERPEALLVTGSNMSGKTTLLRTIGINLVLAYAGAPVCAQSLRCVRMQLLTSMRVKDSLERGVSYFYAEVERLKTLLDAATGANGRALFLLDEILLGTNTRERQLASQEVLLRLLESGASGAVTTHDLSLTTVDPGPAAAVRNVHFRDLLVDGKMRFDYRLLPGVVETTNALRVLEQAGIPVRKPSS